MAVGTLRRTPPGTTPSSSPSWATECPVVRAVRAFPTRAPSLSSSAHPPTKQFPGRRAGRHQGHRLAVVLAVVALLGWRLLIGADEPQQMHLIALHGTRPFASWVGEHSDMSSTSGQS